MTFPKVRLIVSACLFLAWIGFLFFLVVDSRTIVLSKPQFLIAQLYVIVQVRDDRGKADPDVTVEEVPWSADHADQQLAGQVLHVPDLTACAKEHGYEGAGKYLLPLVKSTTAPFLIAPVPHVDSRQALTHGTVEVFGLFSHRVFRRLPVREARQEREKWRERGYTTDLTEEEIRVYPWTPDTRTQVDRLVAGKR
jgi:hypothetical protein